MHTLKPSAWAWVIEQLGGSPEILPLAGDASTRSFFRLKKGAQSYVLMFWPGWELGEAYLQIADWLSQAQLLVPKVVALNRHERLILQTDLGQSHYLDVLNSETVSELYHAAIQTIQTIQLAGKNNPPAFLPTFGRPYLESQTTLFWEWFVSRHLGKSAPAACQKAKAVESVLSEVLTLIEAIPKTVVHFDFHSRNLMALSDKRLGHQSGNQPSNQPGVLDFQDALWGPHTYDLVGLLNDCYVDWPEDTVLPCLERYHAWACTQGITDLAFPAWRRLFDWTALQRHLKNLGVFARLAYKYQKPVYLKHIPRVLGYIRAITQRYDQLAPIERYFSEDLKL